MALALGASGVAMIGVAALPAAASTSAKNGPCTYSSTTTSTVRTVLGSINPTVLITGTVDGSTVDVSCAGAPAGHTLALVEGSALAAIRTPTSAQVNEADANIADLQLVTTDSSGNGTFGAFTVRTTGGANNFAPADPNATCPTTQSQTNVGLTQCLLIVVDVSNSNALVSVAFLFIKGQPVPSVTPTLVVSPTTLAPGDTVTIDSQATTGFWGAALTGAPNATFGVPGPAGGFEANDLLDSVVISPAVYDGTTLTPSIVTGTMTAPPDAPAGPGFFHLEEFNTTPDRGNLSCFNVLCSAAGLGVGADANVTVLDAPTISADPASGGTGTQVAVTGTNWDPQGGPVTVAFASGTPPDSSPALVNADGSIATTVGVSANDTAGSNPIIASQPGSHSAITSTQTPFTVIPTTIATTTTLSSSVNPSVFGQAVILTATVASVPPGSSPTGSVAFSDGGLSLATAPVDGSGNAAITTSSLSIGSHSIGATFLPQGVFLTSTANPLIQVVQRDPTLIALSSSAPTSVFGQGVTITVSVSAAPPGAGAPSGTVTLTDGVTSLGTHTLDPSSKASFFLPTLQVGDHPLVASYSGDPDFLPSSGSADQKVACTSTLTGTVGALVVLKGATCLNGTLVLGPVVVAPGAALSARGATIGGGVFSSAASAMTLCSSAVRGPTAMTATAGFVLLGDAGDDGSIPCGGSRLSGTVTLLGNMGQVELGANQISDGAIVLNTTGAGPDPENAVTEIEANTIKGFLLCAGNSPAPINDGQPNKVSDARLGQCANPGF
jgi:Big-like domain-containing protein